MQNSQVLVGQTLVIHVSGFEPGATVLLQLGPQELVEQIVTDDGGAGTTRVVVPKLRTDSYSITAITATVNATFVVSVVNPATTKPITPAPSSLPTVARSATPTASGTTHATSSQAGTSAAYTPALANTGSPNTFGLTIAGMVLLAFGATAIKIGAPRVFGRHERIAGAHCR
jgi:hypothetical protein